MTQINSIYSNPILRMDNFNYELRKYKIIEILNSMPADISFLTKRNLPSILEVSKQTFANWCNASLTDSTEIPSEKLRIISIALNVSIEKLFNTKPPKFQIQITNSDLKSNILKQSSPII